jgi:hypothetical protein
MDDNPAIKKQATTKRFGMADLPSNFVAWQNGRLDGRRNEADSKFFLLGLKTSLLAIFLHEFGV